MLQFKIYWHICKEINEVELMELSHKLLPNKLLHEANNCCLNISEEKNLSKFVCSTLLYDCENWTPLIEDIRCLKLQKCASGKDDQNQLDRKEEESVK